MSGGFDPMDELSATLEALEPATQRRVKVAPPPVDDFTGALDRPEDDEATDAAEKALTPEEDTFKGDTAGGSDPAEVEPAVVPVSRRKGRGLAVRRPNGPMKQITASIPADVVERLTALRLDADVAGRGFKLTEFVSAALLALPSQPSRVAGLIERYSNQLNFELTSRDEGYLVEKRLSTQITPDAAQRVATIARDVYQSYGTKLSHKDIYAVALLNALATKS